MLDDRYLIDCTEDQNNQLKETTAEKADIFEDFEIVDVAFTIHEARH